LLFEVPAIGLRVPSFGVMLLLACVGALGLTAWRARREKLNPESVFELAIWLMGGGFIGARLLYVVAHPESIRGLTDILRLWQGGIVFYGCIIGGLIGSLIYWYRHPFPFRPMADAVAPGLVLGAAVGRIGCFLNGCCYGSVTHQPWALTFPAGTLPWGRHVQDGLIPQSASHSLPVHPTQLYSLADGLLILALLTVFYPRRRRDGEVMALLMVTYPVTRFTVECFRGDEPALLAGMTLSQWISVVLFVAGLAVWCYLSVLPVGRYADAVAGGDAARSTAIPAPKLLKQADRAGRPSRRP
jgi:phosphatidylglycerol:prolipoprotein diacylglycerol transferase